MAQLRGWCRNGRINSDKWVWEEQLRLVLLEDTTAGQTTA